MAILTLKPGQKSVCAIPPLPPGVEGTPDWNSESDLFTVEDAAEDGMVATVVAADGQGGGAGFLIVTAERAKAADGDDDVASGPAFIATLEVRVEGDGVKFAEVSASTPDQK